MKIDKKALKYRFRLNNGRYESLDPRPMSIPVGLEKPESLQEKLARLVRDEVFMHELAAKGIESFKDADDFDIPDDPIDPGTPYEECFDPQGMTAREQEVRSGVVQEPTMDAYQKALKTVEDYKEAQKAAKAVKRRVTDKRRASDGIGSVKKSPTSLPNENEENP